MRFTHLFTKTTKDNPKDEVSSNAQLLERAGFIYKNSAGIYSYLPLGWRVIQNIARIIREEMAKVDGQEMLMPSLIDHHYYEKTHRENVDIIFKARGQNQEHAPFFIGWTHEEVITEIVSGFINSYKDLPFAAYQIQTKFRNEPRAKSGLLRGREFLMKDLYSFHATKADLETYYARVAAAYSAIFERCGLKAYYTLAAGGDFTSNFTHEFQVLSDVGEDTIMVCKPCGYAENTEISKLTDDDQCPQCQALLSREKSIEVGNIFPLDTKYSEALGLTFMDEQGTQQYVVMGSYGIGLGRTMGTAVEVHHDKLGIIWPETIAPFKFHLIALEGGYTEAETIYTTLKQHTEVVFDDRTDKSAGEKFADADLIGIPVRLVVSAKTVARGEIESKRRTDSTPVNTTLANIMSSLDSAR